MCQIEHLFFLPAAAEVKYRQALTLLIEEKGEEVGTAALQNFNFVYNQFTALQAAEPSLYQHP